MANITFLCTSGSPMSVTREMLYGRGVGGAEYALISLAEAFARIGHNVTVQNRKHSEGKITDHGVLYTDNKHIPPTDVLIVFRVPTDRTEYYQASKRIFWSTDQFVGGGPNADKYRFKEFHDSMDMTVCISPYHMTYFAKQYGIDKECTYIDLGVRLEDYNVADVQRIKNRLLFASVPDRGLHRLCSIWPRIKKAIPDASLTITSDYRLWGSPTALNDKHVAQWRGYEDVFFKGAVSRHELVKTQLESDYLVYPCIYDELFCVTVAEAQVAGAIPITSGQAAVSTTNEFGYVLDGESTSYEWLSEFCDLVIALMDTNAANVSYGSNRTLRDDTMVRASQRFNWDTIAKKWEELF